ncbi:SDR family NAD(P)-dependent oxidoreductase [Nocardia blacklockiae]|uniref:SDR family NAD(P)-dependent oxidoreductase n=1 Tax=Nocardia blacklockiae TaxID=480036 RepID=UPI0018943916|nr:SDR family NAD(P)-dependent oxidoreductase [Nocardia blacklockiae]MBF6170435.1 SDR family NAD(P)-dependent oxidoreductase [Nocardia blacklockiae]
MRPLALVTGASRGIGFALAEQFVGRGYDVVVAAEDESIDAAAATLRDGTAEVRPVRADLRTEDGVRQLYRAATAGGRDLDAVAFNAGVGRGGPFVATELADELDIVDVNVRSTVHLAKLVLPGMVERGAGKLLFTSSVAAMTPGPRQAVYAASKSFVQSFAEALREELRDTHVTVTALLPGPTDTDFFRRAKLLSSRMGQGPKESPDTVARQGVDALLRGDQKVVAGSFATKAAGLVTRVLPDTLKAKAHHLVSAPARSFRA